MEPVLDDAGWSRVDVPGHWRSHPALAASDGPVLYRRAFDAPRLDARRRAFAVFDGIFYDGDVWLDETYLGATQGYFVTHEFEVTEALRAGEHHLLAVEVGCSGGGAGGTRRALNGVFADLPGNPGGLWRPVRVVTTGPVHVGRARVLCTEAGEARGRLVVALTLDADLEVAGTGGAPLPARLAVRVDDAHGRILAEHARDVSLADGENHLSVDIDVERPPRWWPRSLGDQPLCRVGITVDVHDETSDEVSVRTGFREVRAKRLQFSVNGEPLFLHGASQGPVRTMLAEADAADFRRVVELALDAGLDLLRVHEHVSRPELYDAADEAGLLLWQDLPMRGRYARTARGQATAQARAMVDVLGHHPSIATWCAHDAPYLEPAPGVASPPRGLRRRAAQAASLALPSWNKDVLDRSVARALHRADPSRPVLPHSGVPPGPIVTTTDSHLVGGWHDGLLDGLAPTAARFPRLARFVSSFGAPSVPEADGPAPPDQWPNDAWARALSAPPYGDADIVELVPPASLPSFDAWAAATRERQAALVRLAVEDLRRLRDRPTTGFCLFCFADGAPSVSCAVVDHRHQPKPAYDALRDACRPVLAMLEPRSGAVHVVNDTRDELPDVVVRVRDTASLHGVWSGPASARAVSFVGRVPDVRATRGDVVVTLEHAALGTVENRYPASMLQAVARGARRRRLSMLKRASAG
jgi:beta-mannosidase